MQNNQSKNEKPIPLGIEKTSTSLARSQHEFEQHLITQHQEDFKFLGIRWHHLNTPLERRIQTACVLFPLLFSICLPFLLAILFIYLFIPILNIPLWIYVGWFFYSWNWPEQGSKPLRFFRGSTYWKHHNNYFPLKLHKTMDLDPERNYIMGYHPHGVISIGALGCVAGDFSGWRILFPKIKSYLITLPINFKIPLLRELLIFSGIVNSNKKSISYLVSNKKKGNATIIVVGGAEESLEAHEDNFNLVLKNRKGFVKLAIQNGASLVPIYGFGENSLYKQVPNKKGSALRTIQTKFKEQWGFTIPLFHGRGVFQYTFGMMPFRKPVNVVVGKVVEVQQNKDPNQQVVDEIHKQYLDNLTELFETNKARFGLSDDKHLNFI